MKKHIKKVLCAVALIVLCVSAFAIPSFAYTQTMDQTVLGVNLLPIEVVRTDRLAQERDVDVTLSYLFDNALNDTTSPVWYIDEVYNVGGTSNVIYCVYVLSSLNHDITYAINIPDFMTNTNMRDFENQLIFHGRFELSYSLTYFANGGGREERGGGYYSEDADGYFDLGRAVPEEWDNGVVYWHIDELTIEDGFAFEVPYYGPTLADAVLKPISAENIQYSTYIDDVPIGEFLWNSISSFLRTEIFPNVTLYHLFTAIIAIPLFIWFLKLFAGG